MQRGVGGTTHLSHSELDIAALSSSDSVVLHQPPGLFGGKGPKKEDKNGSDGPWLMVETGWREIRGRRISTWAVQAYRVEAMVYGIEASADSMCNSEKTALGEIYWRGVIKKEKQTEIWPDENDSTACSHSGPLFFFRQSARDKVILSKVSFNQPPTEIHITAGLHIHRRSYENTNGFFFLEKEHFIKTKCIFTLQR